MKVIERAKDYVRVRRTFLGLDVAYRCPRWLVGWALVRAMSACTAPDEVPDDVPATLILRRWLAGRRVKTFSPPGQPFVQVRTIVATPWLEQTDLQYRAHCEIKINRWHPAFWLYQIRARLSGKGGL